MITYVYDGSFEGLLSLYQLAREHLEEVERVTTGMNFQPDLFTEVREVMTEPKNAAGCFQMLRAKVDQETLLDIGYAFLSEQAGMEKVILEYIRLLLLHGQAIAHDFSHPTVQKIRRIRDKVSHEILRIQGFVRFRKLQNCLYYAAIEPDHNVIQFLAPHFCARFADQCWVIHDVKRQTAIWYDGRRCRFLPQFEARSDVLRETLSFHVREETAVYAPRELDYQALWNRYFHRIAIAERTNKKAQRQRMPARYWRYLVENVSNDGHDA